MLKPNPNNKHSLIWVECFSILAGVLTTRYPQHAQDFFAYQKTIVHASRSFAGGHWVTYDLCYRRRAAATKSLRWSLIDFTLYNETFTGRAKQMLRCRYCLSEHHASSECLYAPDPSLPTNRLAQFSSGSRPSRSQICPLFNSRNGNQCRFRPCKFLHICSGCQEPHPGSTCKLARPPSAKQPRLNEPAPLRKF